MLTLRQLQEQVEKDLLDHPIKGEPARLYEPMNYMVQLGGKRIRPVAVLMAYQLYQEDLSKAMPLARAIEWFHNFTLIHDDIMDCAPIRRGQPTVHEKWNNNIGILSGDALLIKCYEQLMRGPETQRELIINRFNEVALEVCEGQQRDMDFEDRETVSREEYIQMITQKTSVLLGLAFQMGALAGGATRGEAQKLYDFGLHLGVSFQIQDDWLDLFGAQAKVGKQVGGDVIAGKKTLLIIDALEHIEPAARAELLEKYAGNSDGKVAHFATVFEELGVSARVREAMAKHHQAAREKLESTSLTAAQLTPLYELTDYLQVRQK